MDANDHCVRAEELLAGLRNPDTGAVEYLGASTDAVIALAQAHATLAVAYATRQGTIAARGRT